MSANASILPLSGIPSSISDKWNSGANSTRKESIHLTFKRKDSGRLVEQELPRKRIAFMLLMHSDPVHAERLLARVYNPYHYYLLHIDPGNKNKVSGHIIDVFGGAGFYCMHHSFRNLSVAW